MVTSGTSENTVLVFASMNCSVLEAVLVEKMDLPSELAWGAMAAVVAALPWVASGMSEGCVTQPVEVLVCRFTTMLQMVAPSVPELLTAMKPSTTNWLALVETWLGGMVQGEVTAGEM